MSSGVHFANILTYLIHCRTQKVYGKFFENWKGIGIALSA